MAASRAEIAPFDRSGIRGQEMLQLMRLGVVPFGTVLLALASADEPELNAIDLPMLNPDIASAAADRGALAPADRDAAAASATGSGCWRSTPIPSQVMFCQQAFTGLGDLAGRRVRVSSVGQRELIEALGATPVVTPFAEIVQAVRDDVVQCAITGTLSGNAIGLHEVTTHVSRVAISWGVSIFGANERGLGGAARGARRPRCASGLATLQDDIWRGAEQETEDGLRCNAGRPDCVAGTPGRMTIVEDRPQDRARRQQLLDRLRAARLGPALRRRLRRDLERHHGAGPRHPGQGGLTHAGPPASPGRRLRLRAGPADDRRRHHPAAGPAAGHRARPMRCNWSSASRGSPKARSTGISCRSTGRWPGCRPVLGQIARDGAIDRGAASRMLRDLNFQNLNFRDMHADPARGWPPLGQRPRRVAQPALAGRPGPAGRRRGTTAPR